MSTDFYLGNIIFERKKGPKAVGLHVPLLYKYETHSHNREMDIECY